MKGTGNVATAVKQRANEASWDPDTLSFDDYVRARRAMLLRYAQMVVGTRGDGEDLLQTALTSIYKAWPRIQDKSAIDAYVRRTIINANASVLRRRRVDEYPTEQLPEMAATSDPMNNLALRDVLFSAVQQLSTRQRNCVLLRYYWELSEAEAADVLGVSVGTVKSTASRALARLRADDTLHEVRGTAAAAATTNVPFAVAG
jgi:RNA polymerase sigma-70 factor (sigma-E family)